MKKIILTRGIQCSGKTTWAKKWVLEDPEHRVRFNNDDIRYMLGKYWVPSREDIVSKIKIEFLYASMDKGYEIVIDNMNLNPKEIKFYNDLIAKFNCLAEDDDRYKLEFKDFFISVEECIARDAKRENPIGEKVIRETYSKYKNIIEK